MKKKLLFVCVIGISLSVLTLFSSCKHSIVESTKTSVDERQLMQLSLSYPYLSYKINITDSGYLTTATGSGESEIQKTILLNERSFSKVCKQLEHLDFSSLPKTEAYDSGDVWLNYSQNGQSAFFPYGYQAKYRKTDKPYIDFVKYVINLSPIPIVDLRGKPLKPFHISKLFDFILTR